MKIVSLNGKLAWAIVGYYVQKNKLFKSVSGNSYEAKLCENSIQYIGNNRNAGMTESINEEEFVSAFDSITSIGNINTNTIKSFLPSSLYRKRTPFIALLTSSGILN